ncbi:MAG: hypothetical protein M3548_17225 [Actinomycetota bacterium]|nr:hypothetical protein [Actinomycetota bacterium]
MTESGDAGRHEHWPYARFAVRWETGSPTVAHGRDACVSLSVDSTVDRLFPVFSRVEGLVGAGHLLADRSGR